MHFAVGLPPTCTSSVSTIVIQAILRHSDVAVTREAYIKRDGIDPQSAAAMEALEALVCSRYSTKTSEPKANAVLN